MGLQLLRSGSLKIFGFDREFIRTDPLEVVVEETIEDGVGAAGGDSDQVADEVSQHHGLCKCGRIPFYNLMSVVKTRGC